MSSRKLKTQTLFSDIWNGVYTQVGIKSPQQDAILVGASASNNTRYDLISIWIMKEQSFLDGSNDFFVAVLDEYVGAGMPVSLVPGDTVLLDRDDVVVGNFALAVPGDSLGLIASFKRE